MTKAKMVLAALALLLVMVAGAAPALGEEIALTGVITYEGTKADSTPVYGIKDENAQGAYYLECDCSAYVGERVTVYGLPVGRQAESVLEVTQIV